MKVIDREIWVDFRVSFLENNFLMTTFIGMKMHEPRLGTM